MHAATRGRVGAADGDGADAVGGQLPPPQRRALGAARPGAAAVGDAAGQTTRAIRESGSKRLKISTSYTGNRVSGTLLT